MSLMTSFIPIATDSEGRTVPNALLYSYAVGTNTPKVTYSNVGLTVSNANPLESDGSGKFFDVFLGSGGYKLVVTDQFGVVLWEQDDYYQSVDAADLAVIEDLIAATQQQISQSQSVYSDSGVADAYVLSIVNNAEPPIAYYEGMIIYFSVGNINTGACTVNVETLGIKDLKDTSGAALTAGFLTTNTLFGFIYILGTFYYFFKSGMVTTQVINDSAITTAKIENLAVTTAKINTNAVTAAKMADGTAYKLAGYSSGNAFTEYSNPMRLLASGSFTAAASLSFVLSSLDTSQSVDNCYLIRLIGYQPASDDVDLYATISSDAGSSYVAGTGYYSGMSGEAANGVGVGTVGAGLANWILAGSSTGGNSLSNAANKTALSDFYLYNFNTGTSITPHIQARSQFWLSTANAYAALSGGGSHNATADYDAVKFTWEGGGNFAAVGKYYIFKIPNVI